MDSRTIELPIIDVGTLIGPAGCSDMASVSKQICDACRDVGFFYIRNHGVPQDRIDAVLSASAKFFHLPRAEKDKTKINRFHRGYSALGDALMYGAQKPDYKEFFTMGLELPADDPDVLAGEALRGPNNWPEAVPELRRALSAYYDTIAVASARLLEAIAVGLGREQTFFEPLYRKRLQRTQVVWYPPQPAEMGSEQFGVADHTDFGCITLLWQDNNGGLEVLAADNRWIAATPVEGTMVVNVGDLLQRWTNERFRSTRHRVVNRSGRERFSIASFYDPSYKSIVDPRDFGVSDDEARYEPIAAGDHIVGRINRSFGYRKTLTAPAAAK
jgi:isopenicillin N synthase-like dioxygenase